MAIIRARIGIADIGIGNVRSVANALARVGQPSTFLRDPKDLTDALTHIILPGVGNFHAGMQLLREGHWEEPLIETHLSGKAILGICLGFQLFAVASEESSETAGLGLLSSSVFALERSKVEHLSSQVPHMGFNSVDVEGDTCLMDGIPRNSDFYFTHSYGYNASDFRDSGIVGTTDYGPNSIASLFHHENLMGVQFHPEKSGGAGLQLLKNFAEKC